MTSLSRALLAIGVWLCAASAHAVSISGIVLYAADDFGTPNGLSTITEDKLSAQLWRTSLGGEWHGLAVWQGQPPYSFRTQPLSAPDFQIEIPLISGDNTFTIVGEPGALTRTDDYLRFTINLYFDGNTTGPPGISVLFDKFAPTMGGAVSANRSDYILSLGLQRVDAQTSTSYDDGTDRVTITSVSFLPPERFDPEWDYDFLMPQRFAKSGVKDYIGVLNVRVDPSPGEPATGTGGVGLVPALGTGRPAGIPAAGGVPSAYMPNSGYGGLPSQAAGTPSGSGQFPQRAAAQPTIRPTAPTQRTEPAAEQTAESETPKPGGTTTPDQTRRSTTQTPGAKTTTTPGSTRAAGTPTPGTRTPGTRTLGTQTPASTRSAGPGATPTPGAKKPPEQ